MRKIYVGSKRQNLITDTIAELKETGTRRLVVYSYKNENQSFIQKMIELGYTPLKLDYTNMACDPFQSLDYIHIDCIINGFVENLKLSIQLGILMELIVRAYVNKDKNPSLQGFVKFIDCLNTDNFDETLAPENPVIFISYQMYKHLAGRKTMHADINLIKKAISPYKNLSCNLLPPITALGEDFLLLLPEQTGALQTLNSILIGSLCESLSEGKEDDVMFVFNNFDTIGTIPYLSLLYEGAECEFNIAVENMNDILKYPDGELLKNFADAIYQ